MKVHTISMAVACAASWPGMKGFRPAETYRPQRRLKHGRAPVLKQMRLDEGFTRRAVDRHRNALDLGAPDRMAHRAYPVKAEWDILDVPPRYVWRGPFIGNMKREDARRIAQHQRLLCQANGGNDD